MFHVAMRMADPEGSRRAASRSRQDPAPRTPRAYHRDAMPGSEMPAFRRLERALALWQQRRAEAAPEPVAQFLARHEDLREVLVPLLAGRGGDRDPARTPPP